MSTTPYDEEHSLQPLIFLDGFLDETCVSHKFVLSMCEVPLPRQENIQLRQSVGAFTSRPLTEVKRAVGRSAASTIL